MHSDIHFLARMTDTMTSQDADLSFWDTLSTAYVLQALFTFSRSGYPTTKSFLGLPYVVGLPLAIMFRVQGNRTSILPYRPAVLIRCGPRFSSALRGERWDNTSASLLAPEFVQQLIYNCNARQWMVTACVGG